MRRILLLLAAAMPVTAKPALAAIGCVQAAAVAEHDWALPPGLLLAIGLAETGRPNAATGRLEPMPFSVNVAGTGVAFASGAYAEGAVAALRRRGIASIDVGCFQISLLHHPEAFAGLPEAFDPRANADYAAAFLRRLFQRMGSWEEAVAAYHSADPARGSPYRDRVFRFWHGLGGGVAKAAALPDPHVIRISSAAASIPVYTPATLPAILRASLPAYTNR